MGREVLMGAVAGAVGTVALNMTTYLDIAVRGRPPSSTPSHVVKKVTDSLGVELAADGPDSETATNRRSGLGALMGYVTGIGVGIGYGLLRSRVRSVRPSVAALGLAAAAMGGSNGPMTAMGITDPRSWGAESWAADVVPHLAYGALAAGTYDLLRD